jgi:threonine dehydratase
VTWPITWDDVLAARALIAEHLPVTPLRHYPALDEETGARVWVKHENHLPTNAFKARNALALIGSMSAEQRQRGVVAATRGNHGAGLAWAGALLGVPVTICVPFGNNPEKNAAIRGFGAELIETGHDYDSAAEAADRLVHERGLTIAHSTNDPAVIAGATTITVELLEQIGAGPLDAIVVAVGGGSQAVGALTAVGKMRPGVAVYGVQAKGASAIHDSWHAGRRLAHDRCDTIADGLATRQTYDMTWEPLRTLSGFVAVSEAELAAAIRMLIRTTHNLAEGAGAAGLAGLLQLREQLKGKTVAVILSGSNLDEATLRRVLTEL